MTGLCRQPNCKDHQIKQEMICFQNDLFFRLLKKRISLYQERDSQILFFCNILKLFMSFSNGFFNCWNVIVITFLTKLHVSLSRL